MSIIKRNYFRKPFTRFLLAGCLLLVVFVVIIIVTTTRYESEYVKRMLTVMDVLGNYVVAFFTFMSLSITAATYSSERRESRKQKYELLHSKYLNFVFELFAKLLQVKKNLRFAYTAVDEHGREIKNEFIGDDAVSEVCRILQDSHLPLFKECSCEPYMATNTTWERLNEQYHISEQLTEYTNCLVAIAINTALAIKCESHFELRNGTTISTLLPFLSTADSDYVRIMSTIHKELKCLIKDNY